MCFWRKVKKEEVNNKECIYLVRLNKTRPELCYFGLKRWRLAAEYLYLPAMKASFKYIILLVILSLSGIFVYQLFWISGQYRLLEQRNKEAVEQAIRNADHIELFGRADRLGDLAGKRRETLSQTGEQGETALTTRFVDKDQPQASVRIIERDASLPLKHAIKEDVKKILENGTVRVGNNYSSLSELGLQMQQSLHAVIDTIMPVRLAVFDSLLTVKLKEKSLDLRHLTEIRSQADSSVVASSIPPEADLSQYELYTWQYVTFQPKAYYVYVEPTRWTTLAGMTGILLSSFLILLILIVSFTYMIRFLLYQKTVEQLKDDFTHNVTHELKTPIAISYAAIESIINYNLLDNRAKADKYLHICHEELDRLGTMVEQILSLSLEKQRDIRLVIGRLSLNELVGKIIEQQKLKSARSFRIRVDFRPEAIWLKADRIHLYSIISNLIDNAVKYADKEPEIELLAELSAGKVQIRISDNGPGIPLEYQRYIFDKFYRLPQSRRSTVKGYGIGLFYVKTMVAKHGGTITVESSPGKGTSFLITLPQ